MDEKYDFLGSKKNFDYIDVEKTMQYRMTRSGAQSFCDDTKSLSLCKPYLTIKF